MGKYVDALQISVQGRLQEGFIEELKDKKKAMWELQVLEIEFCSIPGLLGGPFHLLSGRRKNYEFVLRNEALLLEITEQTEIPTLKIKFDSHTLYENDFETLQSIVDDIASFFLMPGFEAKVRRFDLAVDFQGDEGWEAPDVDDITCLAREPTVSFKSVEGRNLPTSFTYGASEGKIQVQIYNKTKELKKSHEKYWMLDVWRESEAYTEEVDVWRVEFRFFRKKLHGLGINTIADLKSKLGDLVRVVVGEEGGVKPWIRVLSSDTREKRKDHRPVAPWWEEICAASLDGMPATGSLDQPPEKSPNLAHTEIMFDAYFERFMVLGGGEGLHPDETSLDEYLDLLKEGYLRRLDKRDLSREEAIDSRQAKMGMAQVPLSVR